MTLARPKNILMLCGAAFVSASLGAAPANATLIVSNAATKNVTCSAGVCAATAKNAVLNAGDLTGMIASSDVTVRSTNKAKDIELKVALSWASSSRLTLDAYQSVTFDKPLTVAGPGALTLTTNDGGSGGELSFLSPGRAIFWDLSSSLVIDGASHTLVGDIATLASDIASDPSGHYALANNYDAGVDGTYASSPIATTFTGTFDGLGNAISHLKINDSTVDDNVGLFTTLGSGGSIQHVRLTGVSVTTKQANDVGSLVAVNHGLLSGEAISGKLTAKTGGGVPIVGGLAGENFGTIDRSCSTASISGVGASSLIGGLVGANEGLVQESCSSGSLVAGAHAVVGGLVGSNTGTIALSFATGNVTAAKYATAGGLVGANGAEIENAYAAGNASGGDNSDVGGFVGLNVSEIDTSYSLGSAAGGAGSLVGGFTGEQRGISDVGQCYWDTTTSETEIGVGGGDPFGVTGLTSAQLQSGLPAGFDSSIWAEGSGINSGFPYLLGNPPP